MPAPTCLDCTKRMGQIEGLHVLLAFDPATRTPRNDRGYVVRGYSCPDCGSLVFYSARTEDPSL